MPQNGPEVSETDLYLLSAIEKLVYRVDYMEKRLRKTEQLVYYLMAGNNEHKKEIYGEICTLFNRKNIRFEMLTKICLWCFIRLTMTSFR